MDTMRGICGGDGSGGDGVGGEGIGGDGGGDSGGGGDGAYPKPPTTTHSTFERSRRRLMDAVLASFRSAARFAVRSA